MVDVDGSNLIPLTSDPAEDGGPSWAPAGDRIAFYSNRDGDWDIYLLDVANGTVSNLTETSEWDEQYARWSPDGRWIAYVTNAPPLPVSHTRAVDLIEVATGTIRRIYSQAGNSPLVEWAPDSRSLIFARAQLSPEEGEIVALDIETGDTTVILLPDGFIDEGPAYGPRRFGF
jgi:TolB protein